MNLVHENPYRIAGILSNATERELHRQQSKIKKFIKIGREADSEFDFKFLNPVVRSEQNVSIAFSNIEQNKDKVANSLLWFIKCNPFDETALNYLINGDKEKAIEIWEKVTSGKEISVKNFSCFNNLGTLMLIGSNQSEIAGGISLKFRLLDSNNFVDFVHSVADETYSIDHKTEAEKLVDVLLTQLNGKYTLSSTIKLFGGCNSETKKYVSKKFSEKHIQKLEDLIEKAKDKRKQDKFSSYDFGLELYIDTKEDLALLKSVLGSSDLKFKMVADRIAKEIMQCGIDYFNAWMDTKDVSDESIKLLKYADSIVVGTQTKDRIRENTRGIEEMKDRELNQAIALLQSIKDAYETNASNIRAQVAEMLEKDWELKVGLKTINYSAIDENIKNSINWGKVDELIKELLVDQSLRKIKESENFRAKEDFWELAHWLKKHSTRNSIISRCIDKYAKIPPILCFEVLSSSVTNSLDKSFYVENIRYVGLKMNIKSFGSQEIMIYKKYINPEGRYSRSSKNPLKGYTSREAVKITCETTELELSGWGNEKTCSFITGDHKIEIYVDHYKVHTHTFKVDWSPLKKAELNNKLNTHRKELDEVKQFKWFRMPETREKEIKNAQGKIDDITKILRNK